MYVCIYVCIYVYITRRISTQSTEWWPCARWLDSWNGQSNCYIHTYIHAYIHSEANMHTYIICIQYLGKPVHIFDLVCILWSYDCMHNNFEIIGFRYTEKASAIVVEFSQNRKRFCTLTQVMIALYACMYVCVYVCVSKWILYIFILLSKTSTCMYVFMYVLSMLGICRSLIRCVGCDSTDALCCRCAESSSSLGRWDDLCSLLPIVTFLHHVRMYVCMYVCMYICMYVYLYIILYEKVIVMYVCTYVCMYICMYVCMSVYDFIIVCSMYDCNIVCMYAYAQARRSLQ
jgi:hypothetical protein